MKTTHKLILYNKNKFKRPTNQHRCNIETLKRIAGARIIWLVHSKRVDSQLRETVHRSRPLRVSFEIQYFRDIVVLQQRVTSKRTQISTG